MAPGHASSVFPCVGPGPFLQMFASWVIYSCRPQWCVLGFSSVLTCPAVFIGHPDVRLHVGSHVTALRTAP